MKARYLRGLLLGAFLALTAPLFGASTSTDAIDSVSTSTAIKAPVRSIATSNITLSGLTAITTLDGSLTPVDGDRWLLTGQTTTTQNLIYVSHSTAWTIAQDSDGTRDLRNGTLVSSQAGVIYRLTTADSIVPGTTALTWAALTATTTATNLADQTDTTLGATLVGVAAGTNLTAGTVRAKLLAIVADSWVTLSRIAAGTFTADATGRAKFANGFVAAAQLGSAAVTPDKLATSALQAGNMVNGYLTATVGSSALTVAVKTLAGTDPSATDPVYVIFRNATSATGDYTVITLSAATSLVVSSGSTLGATNSIAFRDWIVGFNDAGTFRLGIINCLVTSAGAGSGRNADSIYPLGQFPLASSTAEGGAGAADSAQVFYTGTAVSSKPYVVLGNATYETGLATVGTWSAVPTLLDLYRIGGPLPGTVIQRQRNQTGAVATGTTTIPDDDTIPQNTEGDQYMTQAITPTSAANVLRITSQAIAANSSATVGPFVSALFQDAVANALAVGNVTMSDSAQSCTITVVHQMLAALSVATTFKIRVGLNTAGTTTFNGRGGGRKYGGVMDSFLAVEEVMS
jgi:hypothetical protein